MEELSLCIQTKKLLKKHTAEVNWDTALANIEKTFGGPQARPEESFQSSGRKSGVWGENLHCWLFFLERPIIINYLIF